MLFEAGGEEFILFDDGIGRIDQNLNPDNEAIRDTTTPEGLRAAIREIREEILDVIAEMENIRLQVIPQIQQDYAVRVGCWETQLLETELACRRAKRKLALVQAAINDGRKPDDQAVERQLDHELEEWEARVAASLARQRGLLVMASGTRPLSPAESKRIKRIYRTICKRLHPDLHPNCTEEMIRLFMSAKSAYKEGNLDLITAIEVSTRSFEKVEDLEAMSMDELALAYELAQAELKVMGDQLVELKANPIIKLSSKLRDPDWLASTVAKLKDAIAKFDAARLEYESRLSDLLSEGER